MAASPSGRRRVPLGPGVDGGGVSGEPRGPAAWAMTGGTHTGGLPPEAWATALAGLPAMGPGRLRAVLAAWEPAAAWCRVVGGGAAAHPQVAAACRPDPGAVGRVWARAAAGADVAAAWSAHRAAGVGVLLRGNDGYPEGLADDHEAPPVLFARGHPDALGSAGGRRVAIVGTRTCSRYGVDVATELGQDLAAAGVVVVSGLALGVDGAAHHGALSVPRGAGSPPVAVVGSGLDVVYPRRHGRLWAEVAERGLMLSEAPLGTRPEPWRFPVRNRVIAALADVVVVVESHHRGGSVHTVEAAQARDRQVMAVPGSVRSPASALPNALLADGCA
ncbi:MAG: DNA-processing protein DprA, partial [Acidimicrobiales bacterium]